MIDAILIYGPKCAPKREWRRFTALPRVGDKIRNVGAVTEVYWIRDPEADHTNFAFVCRPGVFYPIIYCDESNP